MNLRFLKGKVNKFIYKHRDSMSPGELTYLRKRTKLKEHRIPQFYITAKVHKSPWKTRPIVSTYGSLMSYLSKWVDFTLNKIAKQSPIYIYRK